MTQGTSKKIHHITSQLDCLNNYRLYLFGNGVIVLWKWRVDQVYSRRTSLSEVLYRAMPESTTPSRDIVFKMDTHRESSRV